MSLSEKIAALCERRRFGMKPGLERMEALMAFLGHPERQIAAIHVAGTNGKGSVAAITAAVLQGAGYGAVGRYTSPHLASFNERICIDGVPVSNDILEPAFEAVEGACRRVEAETDAGSPTFFECVTALAFEVFRSQGVRIAVIETGLGGRLDATNVLLPVLSVITSIGLEHREYLGDTIAEIATEKAGILKKGRPAVLAADLDEEARAAIEAVAARVGAPIIDPEVSVTGRLSADASGGKISFSDNARSLSSLPFALPGAYQRQNLATALSALEVFSTATGLEIPDEAFREGLASARWPCRFQQVLDDPPVIVDGAHNPQAMKMLRESLKKRHGDGPLALVAGFCGDKDIVTAVHSIASLFRRAWAVEVPSPRTTPVDDLAVKFRSAGLRDVSTAADWDKGLDEAIAWAKRENGAVVVCGSLFLAGAVADRFGALPWQAAIRTPNELLKPDPKQTKRG